MKRHVSLLTASLTAILAIATGALGGTIYLKSGTIDTSETVASVPKGPKLPEEAVARNIPGAGYYLAALRKPITDEDKAALVSRGAEIVEYIPDSALVIHIEHSQVVSVGKLACVEWVGPFKAEYKSSEPFAEGRGQYIVTLFPGQSAEHVLGKIKVPRLGGSLALPGKALPGMALRILADKSQLSELARASAVAWIEPYVQPRLCNNAAGVISEIPDVRDDLGLYGAGQTVGVADAGLDTGDPATISYDFSGRIIKTYALRRPNAWSDLNGHGTHTTGSFLGSGALSGSNPALRSYDGSFAGVAPEARLVFQSIGDEGQFVFPPLHLGELFQPVYDDGVRVHSNSWGSSVNGQYTVYSNEVDQFVWDHKDFTVVFAVGNEAEDLNQDGVIDKDCLYAPATAKNCIAVGATENSRASGGYQMGYGVAWPSSYPASPIKYDLVSNNSFGMAAFSGRGPTDDGRVKPDICAPGTNIISCRTHAASSSGWAAYDSNYIYWGGTSMSTPQVAGGATLVREYFQREKGINPSAALVKATLINGAVDISPGQYGSTQYQEVLSTPDSSQGWGRLNVKQSLSPDPPVVNEFTDSSTGLSTGAYREYQYTVADASVPFRVTLAWTDYPGAVHAAKELVNDLDLTVTSPTGTVYPTITRRDHINNVEQVKISTPEMGVYTVRVSGYNVPMGPQDYALAVSGGMPYTYVSGAVTTSLGAGVQGALVMLVPSSGPIKRVTTNQSGQYLTHVGPGSYSVQVSKQGWTFAPRGVVVTVASAPVENVNFTGAGSPGSLSGKITSAVGGVVSRMVESPHPYLNNLDQTWVITGHEGAAHIRVHFAEIDLMNDGDTIYALNGSDQIVNTYTGKGEDIWSGWVTGNTIKIRLVTNDYGNIGYGFYADGYETDLIQQGGLQGAAITLSPGGYQATSAADGTYSIPSVPPGTYAVAPSKTHWKFQPASKTVEVPAGGSLSGVEFTAFPPGSITGEVTISTSEVQSVNIQSPHPYPNNYDNTWEVIGPAGANRIRLHFSTLSTEPAWDFVYIMDGDNNVVEIYTSDYADLWTPWISGNIARIELTTDPGNDAYGFMCDKYEAEMVGASLGGAAIDLSPDNMSTTTSSQGVFSFPEVDVGSHTVTPTLSSWVFDPPSVQVSISAGMEEHTLFYVKLGPLTRTSSAKLLSDGLQVTLQGMNVSAVFNGFFYAQDSDRLGGIRVVSTAVVHEGNTVDITGTLSTVDGERRIAASSVTVR